MTLTTMHLAYIGFASAAILVLTMLSYRSNLRRRLSHCLFSVCILVFGLLIDQLLVSVVGGLLSAISLTLLILEIVKKEEFSILKVRSGNEYLKEFLKHYEAEIKKIFPKFNYETQNHRSCYLLLRDLEVAGVLILRHHDDDTLMVELDFVRARYRDRKTGRFLFQENFDYILPPGYEKLITFTRDNKHKRYLREMGFEKSEGTGQKAFYEKHRNPATRRSTMMAASFSF